MALTFRSFELGDFATNGYVVWDDAGPPDACWVIDCPYEPEPMLDFIESKGLKPALCILTHCHCDHIAGLSRLRLRLGPVNILCHREEKGFNEDPNLNLSAFIPPAVSAPPPDAVLGGGELLELGSRYFKVLHTPGHSAGGITLWCPEEELAFVGDTLFDGSIGRLDFPTSDPEAMRRSLDLLMQLPDSARVLPGHGPATTIGAERRSNPYLRPGAF
jgi:glyoxylase-like metal-dependent hydrolase (beta-lactamase superfamily II)